MEIKLVFTAADVAFCKEVILAFRTNLNENGYVNDVLSMIKDQSFKLAYIPNPHNTKAAAFIGYRYMFMLRTGPIIYIDDLYTSPDHRGKGLAAALLDHVFEEAKTNGIQSVHLDSGYTLHPAHRLYLHKGYDLACHHFVKKVG